jgi:hypothetical protein
VGRDVTVTIAGAQGNIVIPSSQVTHFDAKPLKREDWSRPLNSPPEPLYMPDGWRGTIEIDRSDATLDTFQATLEANFWNGSNQLSGTIVQTIVEDNGSITQYQYNNVMFWVEDPGNFRADGKVSQRMEFSAGIRLRIT